MESSDAVGLVLGTLFIVVCVGLPIYLSYRTKWMAMRQAAPQTTQEMQALWDTARRMESRIGYLENVLDTEAPGWRQQE